MGERRFRTSFAEALVRPARYDSPCARPRCTTPITVGDPIRTQRGKAIHAHCPPPDTAEEPTGR